MFHTLLPLLLECYFNDILLESFVFCGRIMSTAYTLNKHRLSKTVELFDRHTVSKS